MSNGKQTKGENEARDFRRFIEESFPVKEVGEASAREKNIRHGHISTLHIWWARRPLAASRATAYAALTPAPKDAEEWQKKRDFIVQLSQWENSNNQSLLERARREILEANGGVPPKVLDPFSGGGSYPLEALRLGCDSYANDYNPVAVLVEKATLEYPQKFGRPFEGMPDWAKPQTAGTKDAGGKKKGKKKADEQIALFDPTTGSEPTDFNPLLNAVRYWGEWVLEEVKKELAEFYPVDPDGSIHVGYIWARSVHCQNPTCGAKIPLLRQYLLSDKAKKKISLYPAVNERQIKFEIVGIANKPLPKDFDPSNGTINKSVITCPVCSSVIDAKTTRKLFRGKESGQELVAVILDHKGGKIYREVTEKDKKVFSRASTKLEEYQKILLEKWGIAPIPDEIIPPLSGKFNVTSYGMNTWGSLFNDRQTLVLLTFVDKIREATYVISQVLKENQEFLLAITTYLAITLNNIVEKNNTISRWVSTKETIAGSFGRQSLPMVWDYIEPNPLGNATGSWASAIGYNFRVIEHCSQILKPISLVTQNSAMQLPHKENYFDAILTDPPYYYSITYADLSDFFYVWFKRSLAHIAPDYFATPLTPKADEIIEKKFWDKSSIKDKEWYEDKLKNSLVEAQRVLKTNGIIIIVYAHKTTEGWETLINAVLDSGLVVTSSWPINTEMSTRLIAKESAALASSIYIVARKSPRQPTGFYNDVRTELNQHLDAKLHRLWEEGIGGGDFFIAAIGSAIEVFGKYEQVMDYEGNIVRADRLLEEVRSIATNYAVKQILHNGFAAEITPMARFYVLWRWNYGEALVPFDEANKLAHSCGLDLSLQFSKNGFIKKEKEFVRMLGPQGRKLDDLDDPRDMIDVMHKALLLWEKGQRSEMVKALADRGFGKSEAFYRVAQAISETLPLESKEKKLLDGFLAGRDRVQEEVEKSESQGKMF